MLTFVCEGTGFRTMTCHAAQNLRRLTVALLVSLSMTTSVTAAPKESVQRVTADYKAWIASHGVELEDRVRILLKPDRILVSLKHERGSTRLTYTADGTQLISEVTVVEAVVVAENTCRFFCRDDDDDRRKRKSSSGSKVLTASLTSVSTASSTSSTTSTSTASSDTGSDGGSTTTASSKPSSDKPPSDKPKDDKPKDNNGKALGKK